MKASNKMKKKPIYPSPIVFFCFGCSVIFAWEYLFRREVSLLYVSTVFLILTWCFAMLDLSVEEKNKA